MTLAIDPAASSSWMPEFHKQLVRGKHVLLYGNVADQFLLNGEYLPLNSFLDRYFEAAGFEVYGWYDPVDTLELARPAMEETFRRLAGGSGPAPAAPGRPARAGPDLTQPEPALAAIRAVLRQTAVPAGFVIDFSDRLFGDPERQSADELRLAVLLKKILLRSDMLDLPAGHPLHDRKNPVVAVASQLGMVPPWLYHENPLLALVQVGRPTTPERAGYLRANLRDHFHDGRVLPAAEAARVERDFADLTDGMTFWDLEAVSLTSVHERMPVGRVRELVDYYKYGRRDDPWERLDLSKVRDARARIEGRVVGQAAAVEAVVNMLVAARVGVTLSGAGRSGRPRGTFFFVGPTGVGKTEMAKALTELVFGDEAAFARFDMSEFAESHAAEKLTGSPPGYVGYDRGGQLTNRVRERPFSLLLFDEIEKADGGVMDKFLQILEDGRLTDGKGQTAFFSQSAIIFTSNIGSGSLRLQDEGGGLVPADRVREHYLAEVRHHFTRQLGRPELLNRLGDNILVFDLLRPEHVRGVCGKFLRALAASAQDKRGLRLTFPGDSVGGAVERVMQSGDNLLFGGRQVKTVVESLVERPLNRWIFYENPRPGAEAALTVQDAGGRPELRVNGRPIP